MRLTFGTSNPNDGNPDNQNHISFNATDAGQNGVNLPGHLIGLQGIYTILRPNTSQYTGITGHADVLRPDGTCPSNCNFQIPVDRVDVWLLE